MKKVISIILAVLMTGSCFAVSASAARFPTLLFEWPKGSGWEGRYGKGALAVISPATSGTYKLTIVPEGPVDSVSYSLEIAETGAEVAPAVALPYSAEYELTAGEDYYFWHNFTSKSTGDVTTHVYLYNSDGFTWIYTFTPNFECFMTFNGVGVSEDFLTIKPKVSGIHKVTISYTGTFNFESYTVERQPDWSKGDPGGQIAEYDAFPESAEYDMFKGRSYLFCMRIENTGAAVFHFEVENPKGEKTRYDITPRDDLKAKKYKLSITPTGKFEFRSFRILKAVYGEWNYEVVESFDAFPKSVEYDVAAGEIYRYEFEISRDTDDPVTIRFELEDDEPEVVYHWWDGLPAFLQWILRIFFFGWIWMR